MPEEQNALDSFIQAAHPPLERATSPLAADLATNPILGQQAQEQWRNQEIPVHRRVEHLLQTHAQAQRPWAETSQTLADIIPGVRADQLREPYEQQRQMEAARQEFADWEEPTLRYLNRRVFPFVSAIGTTVETNEYANARRRFEKGKPEPGDYRIIARYERQQENEQSASLGGQITSSLAHAPAVLGEFAVGGLPFRGGTAAARGLGSYLGQAAVQTALAPSAWAPEAANRAALRQEPSSMWEFRNLAPAAAIGYLNTLVLGTLQRTANDIPGRELGAYLRRGLQRTGLGLLEQQGADLIAGALTQDSNRPAGYGVLGDLLQGRGGDALKHLVVQGVTFAAFSALHEGQHRPITHELAGALQAFARRGMSREQAMAELTPVNQLHQASVQQGMTREEARALYEQMPRGLARDYALALAGGLRETPIPEGGELPRPLGRSPEGQQVEPAPPRLHTEADIIHQPAAGPEPGIDRGVEPTRSGPPAPEPGTGIINPVPSGVPGIVSGAVEVPLAPKPSRPVEPAPVAPKPPERFAAVSDTDIRGVAKQLGLAATGKRAEVIDRIIKKGGTDFLRFLDPIEHQAMLAERKTSKKWGTKNRVAFDEDAKGAGAVAVTDVDRLGSMSKEQGDAVIRAKIDAMRRAGLEPYHVSQDEFNAHATTPQELHTKLELARQYLREATGADFSFGVGRNLAEADNWMRDAKDARKTPTTTKPPEAPTRSKVAPGGQEPSKTAKVGPEEALAIFRRAASRFGIPVKKHGEGRIQGGLEEGRPVVYVDKDHLVSSHNGNRAWIEASAQEEAFHAHRLARFGPEGGEYWEAAVAANPELRSALARVHHGFLGTGEERTAELRRMEEQVRQGGHITEWHDPSKRAAAERLEAILRGEPVEPLPPTKEMTRADAERILREQFEDWGDDPDRAIQDILRETEGMSYNDALDYVENFGFNIQQMGALAKFIGLEGRPGHAAELAKNRKAMQLESAPETPASPEALRERIRQRMASRQQPSVQVQAQIEAGRPAVAMVHRAWRSGMQPPLETVRAALKELAETSGLTQREMDILDQRFYRTMEDVAAEQGVTRQRIQQIEKTVLEKLGLPDDQISRDLLGLQKVSLEQVSRLPGAESAAIDIRERQQPRAEEGTMGGAERIRTVTRKEVSNVYNPDVERRQHLLTLEFRREDVLKALGEAIEQEGARLTPERQTEYERRIAAIDRGGEEAIRSEEERLGLRKPAEPGTGGEAPVRREGAGGVPEGGQAPEVSPPSERSPALQGAEAPQGTTPPAGPPRTDLGTAPPAPAGGGTPGGNELGPVAHRMMVDLLRAGDGYTFRHLEEVLRSKYGLELPEVREMQRLAREAAGPDLPELRKKPIASTGRGVQAQMRGMQIKAEIIQHINEALLGREAVREVEQVGKETGVAPAAVQGDLAALAAEVIRPEGAEGEVGPGGATPAGGELSEGPDFFFGPPSGGGQGPGGAGSSQGGGRVGAFDITRTVEAWMPTYREGGRPRYRIREQAAEIGKMEAGDVPSAIHELAHHIAVTTEVLPEASRLPAPVRAGLRQFDYEPNRQSEKTAMHEGFAEWLRRRTMGQLQNLTPEQQAAAGYLETLMRLAHPEGERSPWANRLNDLRDMYQNMVSGTPIQQAAGMLSPTGQPPAPALSPAEQAATLWQRVRNWWQDNVTNNLAVLKRAGMDRAYTIWSRLQFGEQGLARRFGEEGVGTLIDGKWTVIGPSKAEIIQGLLPADLQPIKPSEGGWWSRLQATYDKPAQVSRAGLYATAQHVISEWKAGRHIVSEEQYRLFQQAMTEFQQDPAFVQRATEFHRRLTSAYNAGLDALASPDVHRLSPELVKALKEKRPDYVPTTRVKEEADWKQTASPLRRGHENMSEFLHERSGSGEQIVDPLVGYESRLATIAAQMQEQLRRNAVAEYLKHEKMGEWGLQASEPVIDMEGKIAYMKPEPWSKDPSKNTWYWFGEDGKLQNWRIKDRALYDLITHQQGNASYVTQFFKAFANIAPFRWSAELVRKGATYISVGFQGRNLPRDSYEFMKNTIDQASGARLPEFYKRVYAAEWDILRGRIPKDEVFNLFARERGREQRMFAFETPGIETARSKAEIVKQTFNVLGAGELGPRFLEFVNRLKAQGWTEARLEAEIKKAREMERAGGQYQDPVPWSVLQDAMEAANEVTVPFSRLGTMTREINKLIPFFGPAVSGMAKAVRNWRENTRGAAIALGGYLAARLLHWAAFHDEDWYKELTAHDRFNNFVVPTPFGLRRLPGARDLEVPISGFMVSALEGLSGQRPDVAGLIAQSWGAVAPPTPLPPIVNTIWQVGINRNWMWQPIVPRREEHTPLLHQALEYQAPYAAEQLLGGGGGLIRRGPAGLIPFPEVRNAHRSIDEVYNQLHSLEGERTLTRRTGRAFSQEREYQILHQAQTAISQLNQVIQGRQRSGRGVIEGTPTAQERIKELQERQLQIARRALQAAR